MSSGSRAASRQRRAWFRRRRDSIVLATKAGRYGENDFDFSPTRIRRSLENSLKLLGTDCVDIFQLHDIEFVGLEPVLTESYAELLALKQEGKCRFIGMTGYPVATFQRVMSELDVDVVLTYAKGTLLDDSITTDLLPVAESNGVGLMNAAAVALGLLTPGGSTVRSTTPRRRPYSRPPRQWCDWPPTGESTSRSWPISTRSNAPAPPPPRRLREVQKPAVRHHCGQHTHRRGDLIEMLALRPPAGQRQWQVGFEENN